MRDREGGDDPDAPGEEIRGAERPGDAVPCRGKSDETHEGRWRHDGEDEEDRTPGIMGLVVVRNVDQVTGRMNKTEIECEGEQGRQRQGRERDGDDLEGIAPPPLSSGPSRALSDA